MNVILSECHLQFPQARLGSSKSSKVPRSEIKERVAALLLASDAFLIRSEPLVPWDAQTLFLSLWHRFLRVAV